MAGASQNAYERRKEAGGPTTGHETSLLGPCPQVRPPGAPEGRFSRLNWARVVCVRDLSYHSDVSWIDLATALLSLVAVLTAGFALLGDALGHQLRWSGATVTASVRYPDTSFRRNPVSWPFRTLKSVIVHHWSGWTTWSLRLKAVGFIAAVAAILTQIARQISTAG